MYSTLSHNINILPLVKTKNAQRVFFIVKVDLLHYMLWVDSSSLKRGVVILTPGPVNVTLFERRNFTDVLKLR